MELFVCHRLAEVVNLCRSLTCTGENLRLRKSAKIPIQFLIQSYRIQHQSLHIVRRSVWSRLVWSFSLLWSLFIYFFLFTCSPISPRSFSRSWRGGPGSLCFLLNCAAYPIPKARITSLLFLCCLCFTHYRHKSVRNPREQNAREQNGCALV